MTEAFSRHADITLWVAGIGGKKKEVLESYGVKGDLAIKELPASSGILWPRSFFRALAFRRVVRKAPEGTVFYTREGLLAFPLIFASRRFRNNFFYEMHSFTRHKQFVYRVISYFARGIISTSESKVETLQTTFGVSRERVLVAPNVLDPADFIDMPSQQDARNDLHISGEKPVIVFTGRPSALRGIDLILELALRMKGRATFICVGGAQREIDCLHGKFGFDQIIFIPFVPHKDIMRYMAAADILIAPQSARQEFEEVSRHSSPMKVLEYMATGTPSLFSRIPAIEKIVGADNSFLVEPDSPEAWERKIAYVLDHNSEVKEQVSKMRQHALTFHWEGRATVILEFLKKRYHG